MAHVARASEMDDSMATSARAASKQLGVAAVELVAREIRRAVVWSTPARYRVGYGPAGRNVLAVVTKVRGRRAKVTWAARRPV